MDFTHGSFFLEIAMIFTVVVFSSGKIAKHRHYRFLGWFAGAVFLAAVLVSLASHRNILISRYYIFLNPLLLIIFAIMIDTLPMTFRFVALLIYCFGFTEAYSIVKPHWREAADYVQKSNGQIVLTTKSVGIQMPYYRANHILVERVKLDLSFVKRIQEKRKSFSNIWFVDAADNLDSIELSEKLLRESNFKYELVKFPMEPGPKQESGEQLVFAIHIL